jgi:hypothetical protein
VTRFIEAHDRASRVNIIVSFVAPVFLYVGAIAIASLFTEMNCGGPCNVVFIPLVGGLWGLGLTVCVYRPAGYWLENHVEQANWTRAVGLAAGAAASVGATALALAWAKLPVAALCAFLASGVLFGVLIQWFCIARFVSKGAKSGGA